MNVIQTGKAKENTDASSVPNVEFLSMRTPGSRNSRFCSLEWPRRDLFLLGLEPASLHLLSLLGNPFPFRNPHSRSAGCWLLLHTRCYSRHKDCSWSCGCHANSGSDWASDSEELLPGIIKQSFPIVCLPGAPDSLPPPLPHTRSHCDGFFRRLHGEIRGRKTWPLVARNHFGMDKDRL